MVIKKLDKKIKEKWVKALRSGDYKQGKKRLTHAGRYCCLGVLAKEMGCSVIHTGYDLDTPHFIKSNPKMNAIVEILDQPSPSCTGRVQVRLTTMNDEGADFDTIADWIEKEL